MKIRFSFSTLVVLLILVLTQVGCGTVEAESQVEQVGTNEWKHWTVPAETNYVQVESNIDPEYTTVQVLPLPELTGAVVYGRLGATVESTFAELPEKLEKCFVVVIAGPTTATITFSAETWIWLDGHAFELTGSEGQTGRKAQTLSDTMADDDECLAGVEVYTYAPSQ